MYEATIKKYKRADSRGGGRGSSTPEDMRKGRLPHTHHHIHKGLARRLESAGGLGSTATSTFSSA